MEKSYYINDDWYIAHDKNNVGIDANWQNSIQPNSVKAYVPTIIQQFLPNCHGVAWYWKNFDNTIVLDNEKLILRFGGVDYKATVWLNGKLLGSYEGGETPFEFDVTSVIKDKGNLLAVRVVNPTENEIDGFTLNATPHRNKVIHRSAGSCLNHGGIWYGVTLSALPKARIIDKQLVGDINGNLTVDLTLVSEFEKANATVTVTLYDKNEHSDKVVEISENILLNVGENKTRIALFVPNVKLWDCEEPNLYRVFIKLEGYGFKHVNILNFGFREFCTKDGYFYLNGKKIFLKSAHSGNAFPIGQGFPVHPGHARQDFIYAKACGFNMLRAISGLFRPEQLDIADELGLMVYEESYASWCVAYSHWNFWKDKEEFEKIRCERAVTDMPIDEFENIAWRWKNSTTQMINRDKNHTCVVIWGLLNETMRNGIFYTAVDYIKQLRQIDKTRLVLLNSGRFDYDHSIGSASNPYSEWWDNVWGNDGDDSQSIYGKNQDEYGYVFSLKNAGDHHRYADSPLNPQTREVYKTLGKDAKLPIFLSEFGNGSLFNVIEEYKHFVQFGYRQDLEDCAWLKYQSDCLEKDWERLGLKKVFPFAESFLKESQRKNAKERKNLFDIIRANNCLAGYSLTGLLDHGMCGEGLWSYWRRFKPEMFDAVSDGWSKLKFCLFPPRCVQVGENFEFEAFIANDGVLKSGEYHASFAIANEDGVVAVFDKTFTLNGEDFSTFITKESFKLDNAGTYKILATLKEGSPNGYETEFYVIDKPVKIEAKVKLVNVQSEVEDLLAQNGVLNRESNVVIAEKVNANNVSDLIQKAKDGATVAFIDVNLFKGLNNECLNKLKDIIPDLAVFDGRDWLYHKELVIANKEVFDGLGKKIIDIDIFNECFPHVVFKTEITPNDVICPGFQTGYHVEKDAYGLYHAIEGFKVGKGMIYLFTFPLDRNSCFDRLFMNFVQYLSKRS